MTCRFISISNYVLLILSECLDTECLVGCPTFYITFFLGWYYSLKWDSGLSLTLCIIDSGYPIECSYVLILIRWAVTLWLHLLPRMHNPSVLFCVKPALNWVYIDFSEACSEDIFEWLDSECNWHLWSWKKLHIWECLPRKIVCKQLKCPQKPSHFSQLGYLTSW